MIKYLKPIDVFTDGSAMNKKDGIYCGYGVYFPNSEFYNIYDKFRIKPLTNQRAELFAIYKAIRIIRKKSKHVDINIYTDSMYSINSLTIWIESWIKNDWKTANKKEVMNKDIINVIYSMIKKHKGIIKFIHVKAHTNGTSYEAKCNEIVDDLAKKGALLIE